MFTLHIQHVAPDYEAWKRMFDSDPLDRKGSGVRAFRVMRPVDDPHFVMIDLDFDARADGERMQTALEELWKGPGAAVIENPHARIVEVVEATEL